MTHRQTAEPNQDYKYLIWKEDTDDDEFVMLHFVRRNSRTWRKLPNKYKNRKWYFKDSIPSTMTPNKDIKDMIRTIFNRDSYDIGSNDVIVRKAMLDMLYEFIDKYFTRTSSL